MKKTNKSNILLAAYDKFRRQGYFGTSMDDIAREAGLLKGSLYHYFSSKEDLLVEVLRFKEVQDSLGSFSIAYDSSRSAQDRLKGMLSCIDDQTFIDKGGCIFGNMSLELSDSGLNPLWVIEQFFTQWIDAIKHIYFDEYDETHSFLKAQSSLKELQGGIMLARVYGDSAYLTEAKEVIMINI